MLSLHLTSGVLRGRPPGGHGFGFLCRGGTSVAPKLVWRICVNPVPCSGRILSLGERCFQGEQFCANRRMCDTLSPNSECCYFVHVEKILTICRDLFCLGYPCQRLWLPRVRDLELKTLLLEKFHWGESIRCPMLGCRNLFLLSRHQLFALVNRSLDEGSGVATLYSFPIDRQCLPVCPGGVADNSRSLHRLCNERGL